MFIGASVIRTQRWKQLEMCPWTNESDSDDVSPWWQYSEWEHC